MIAALLKLKTNVDSGQFDAIQLAAARILGPEGDATSPTCARSTAAAATS